VAEASALRADRLFVTLLPAVFTQTGLDIHRYICSVWFGGDSLCRGQQGGIAGQEPAAVWLFAPYRDTMTGELLCFSAGDRDHG